MVMATPSPQQVGREFVRQYYTVLHEAPDILHRFYSAGSTFVHGGVDRPGMAVEEPVSGQLDIDKKIKQLNFKDCHTKIRQVDSQSTIGNGVVVQVTGELSNNGEPMRRFMQTFVLAPQTPKKFYVHNDIFRYQDEVFQDNSDTESEEAASVAPTPQQHQPETVKQQAAMNMNYYQESNEQAAGATVNVEVEHQQQQVAPTSPVQQQQPVPQSPETVHVEVEKQQREVDEVEKSESAMLNGHYQQEVEVQHVVVTEAAPAAPLAPTNPPESELAKETIGEVKKEEFKQETTQSSDVSRNSWAKIISSSSGSSSNADQAGLQLTGGNPQVYQTNQYSGGSGNASAHSKYGKENHTNTGNFNNYSNSKPSNKPTGHQGPTNGFNSTKKPRSQQPPQQQHQHQQQQQQPPQPQQPQQQQQQQQQQQPPQPQQPQQPRLDSGSVAGAEDGEKRFSGRYPDGQQVFVGNLNQDLSEVELKAFFGTYGKVLEVRINTNTKQQSGRRLPNYGFVVFDDKQSVEALLSASKSNSLTYKNEKGVEYRLNVEEKRARLGRVSSGFGGGKSNRATRSSSNGSRSGGQQQQAAPATNGTNKKGQANNYSSNTHSNDYAGNNGGFTERRKEGAGGHDNQIADGGQRKNNPRRS